MSSVTSRITLAATLAEQIDGHPELVATVLPRLVAMLDGEDDPDVLCEVITGLGFAWDERAVLAVLDGVALGHPDSDVRLAVAQALPSGAETAQTLARVFDALIVLSRDAEGEVRNWACYGLGQLEADTAAVRDALVERLTDDHPDARCEALVALARTGDPRVLPALRDRLLDDPDVVLRLELVAAAELADPALLPDLERLRRRWAGDDDEFATALRFAMARCHPDAAARAAEVEHALLGRLGVLCADHRVTLGIHVAYPGSFLVATGDFQLPPATPWARIWPDREPATYPLEQEAQAFHLTLRQEATAP